MRVLITGATGQLGSDLVIAFEGDAHHHVIAASHEHLDVSDRHPARRGGAPGRVDRR
jgi:dTDP-4-dehydrorhamnose reductase